MIMNTHGSQVGGSSAAAEEEGQVMEGVGG